MPYSEDPRFQIAGDPSPFVKREWVEHFPICLSDEKRMGLLIDRILRANLTDEPYEGDSIVDAALQRLQRG